MNRSLLALGLIVSLHVGVGAEPGLRPPAAPPAISPAVNEWFRSRTGMNVEEIFRSSTLALTPSQKEVVQATLADLCRSVADGQPLSLERLDQAFARVWDVLDDGQRQRAGLLLQAHQQLMSGQGAETAQALTADFTRLAQQALRELHGDLGKQSPPPFVLDILDSLLRNVPPPKR